MWYRSCQQFCPSADILKKYEFKDDLLINLVEKNMMMDDIICLLFYVSQVYSENRDPKSKEHELKSLQFRNKWNMFTVAAAHFKTRKGFFSLKWGVFHIRQS